MKPLTPVNKSIRDFRDDLTVGMVLVMLGGAKHLVGDINDLGGAFRDHPRNDELDDEIILGYYTIDWDVSAFILEPLKITDIVAGARILDSQSDQILVVRHVEQRRVYLTCFVSMALDDLINSKRFFKEPK